MGFAESNDPDSYQMVHRPPRPNDGAPLHDLTKIYPDDVYQFGARYYGSGDGSDAETWAIVFARRNKPDRGVWIYRAIPKGLKVVTAKTINGGDWVAIRRGYAVEHGRRFNEGYKILKKRVRADEIFTQGDSIEEWGYWPNGKITKVGGGLAGDDDVGEVTDVGEVPEDDFIVKQLEIVPGRDGKEFTEPVTPVQSGEDLVDFITGTFPEIDRASQEWFGVVVVDNGMCPTGVTILHKGALTYTMVDIPDLLRRVLMMAGNRFMIFHNHPSGIPTPSADDLRMTNMIQAAAAAVKLKLLDHVIICAPKTKFTTQRDFYSFQGEGKL